MTVVASDAPIGDRAASRHHQGSVELDTSLYAAEERDLRKNLQAGGDHQAPISFEHPPATSNQRSSGELSKVESIKSEPITASFAVKKRQKSRIS